MNDDPKMSFVASCRLNGRTLFFIERFTPNFDAAEVFVEADGHIPAFVSEADARAAIERRFPLPRGHALTEQSSIAEITAAMEDEYSGKFKLAYDLDAAREWATAPGPQGLTPEQALDVWELCWQVGEAPRPQRLDPMGMVAIYENIQRDPANRDGYEIVLLGMKLSGLVIMANRNERQPATWDLEVPEMAEFWPPTDFARLGGILTKGVEGFAGRLTRPPLPQ
jgi:hypothetical protein